MTVLQSGSEVTKHIIERFPEAVSQDTDGAILVESEFLPGVAEYLKVAPELGFDYLNHVTAVDYYDYFEVVYMLTSLERNRSLVLKTRCYDRENPAVPSVARLWQGADFQEREIYDLMGIRFEGHPNLNRIVLWEGFDGHPQRRDFL